MCHIAWIFLLPFSSNAMSLNVAPECSNRRSLVIVVFETRVEFIEQRRGFIHCLTALIGGFSLGLEAYESNSGVSLHPHLHSGGRAWAEVKLAAVSGSPSSASFRKAMAATDMASLNCGCAKSAGATPG